MTLISRGREITFQGQSATLTVRRHNARCWGRINTADGRHFDVESDDVDDQYDEPDEAALDIFEKLAANPDNVEEVGW